MPMKLLTLIVVSSGLCFAGSTTGPKTELGELNGAKFRIDIPENWNGGLVIYCHGYSAEPVAYKDQKLAPLFSVFTEQGYALAQSGYAAGGWAIQEAVNDTESLRRYFITKYGKPKETFVTGHSMGGFLTMMLMERFPTTYDAGLALCGPLAPTNYFLGRGAFDARVVFDYYFPGALPPPDRVPADFRSTQEKVKEIIGVLDSQPEKSASLRRITGAHNNKDLGSSMVFLTDLFRELQQRAGGNPFDNRDIIYESPDNDYNALNQGVKRYQADPRAAEYVRTWYTPTGRLSHPMLAVHTTYDPLVPVRIPSLYPGIAELAGSRDLFVQEFVEHDGHCTILPPEIKKAFSSLREWKNSGVRPVSGLIRY
jgi:pimeloyl-ACP methyl ester carboxylesterase